MTLGLIAYTQHRLQGSLTVLARFRRAPGAVPLAWTFSRLVGSAGHQPVSLTPPRAVQAPENWPGGLAGVATRGLRWLTVGASARPRQARPAVAAAIDAPQARL